MNGAAESLPARRLACGEAAPETVCHVVHTLDFGGAEVLARQFALRHRSAQRSVFACLDGAGAMAAELRAAGVVVQPLERRAGVDLRCAWRLARFCRRQNVRLVHAHQYTPFLYTALARWMGWRGPILFHEHGRDWPDYRRWKRVWANRLLLRSADRIVAVGAGVRQALIDHEGLPPGRIRVIYNGVDPARYDPARPQRAAVRTELGIGPEELAVFQVARLDRLKDHATALQTLDRLRERQPGLRLFLVGEGEERGNIQRQMTVLRLDDRVRLLGARGDVPRLLQAADLFLLTSITEGIPLTLLEAMASSLACVATCVGGVAEVIVPNETGLLAPSGDPENIACQLDRLSSDPALRKQMGRAGRQRIQQRFAAEQMHASYRQVYGEMLGESADR